MTDDDARALDAYEQYSGLSVDALAEPQSEQPTATFDEANESAREALKRKRQDNKQRGHFYSWATWVAVGCISGNFGIFVAYMCSQWGRISDTVMVAWISATIVEVIGIVVIIAKYLFHHDDES
ncbi:hypothetical protein [Tomitella gaofuii]|uniref:hypothetical protein n=1 Tax=Tomitella gaofuii TaxID=2760083 RepID=UPI0015FD547C|nr:hypothetical protein [Tomitella gaofuii]